MAKKKPCDCVYKKRWDNLKAVCEITRDSDIEIHNTKNKKDARLVLRAMSIIENNYK